MGRIMDWRIGRRARRAGQRLDEAQQAATDVFELADSQLLMAGRVRCEPADGGRYPRMLHPVQLVIDEPRIPCSGRDRRPEHLLLAKHHADGLRAIVTQAKPLIAADRRRRDAETAKERHAETARFRAADQQRKQDLRRVFCGGSGQR